MGLTFVIVMLLVRLEAVGVIIALCQVVAITPRSVCCRSLAPMLHVAIPSGSHKASE